MLRNILALMAGIIAGVAAIGVIQWLNFQLFPPPPGLDPEMPEDVARILQQVSPWAIVLLEVSYVAGALASGFVAARLARPRPMALALTMGAVFTLFNIANLLQIPHPLWLAVLTTATFLPLAWLGGRLALGMRTAGRAQP